MSRARIEIRDIEKTYKPDKLLPLAKERPAGAASRKAARVLRGITLDIHEGQNVGIVGESGCGKTTLAKLVVHMLHPDKGRHGAGRIKAGALVSEGYFSYLALRKGPLFAWRRRLAYVLSVLLTGRDVLPEIEELMLNDLELDMEQVGSYTRELSGGEKKRVLLAKSLASMGKLSSVTIRQAAGRILGRGPAVAGQKKEAARVLDIVEEDLLRVALTEELCAFAKDVAGLLRSEHGNFAVTGQRMKWLMDRASEPRLCNRGRLLGEGQDTIESELRAARADMEARFVREASEGPHSGAASADDVCELVAASRGGSDEARSRLAAIPRGETGRALEREMTDFLADLDEQRLPLRSEHGVFSLDRGSLAELLDTVPAELLAEPGALLAGGEATFLAERLQAKLDELGHAVDAVGRTPSREFPFPKFLILDEPMRGIDSVNKLKIVRDLQQAKGAVTLVVITHDIRILAPLCERIVVMYGGLIQEMIARSDLPLAPDAAGSAFADVHPYTAALIRGEFKGEAEGEVATRAAIPVAEETGAEGAAGCVFRLFCPRFQSGSLPPDVCRKCETVEPPLVQASPGEEARPDQPAHHIRCWAYLAKDASEAERPSPAD